jgi:hypothetical protein
MNNNHFSHLRNVLFHSTTAVWVSVLVLALSNACSAYQSIASRQVAIVQIQQSLRDRFLLYKPVLDSLRIEDYPHKKTSYSENERYQVRRYWSEIVFNEYVTIKRFGSGILKDNWSEPYGKWVTAALKYQVIREEYCIFLKNPEWLGAFYNDFRKTIELDYKLSGGKDLNCNNEEITRRLRTKS